MRLFLAKCAALTVLASGSVAGLALLAAGRDYSRDPAYISAVIDKQDRLERLASPKIIFAGGSNLVFSQDTAALGKSMGMSPVNLGLHASIGLSWMLAQAGSALKAGDLAVVIPEFEQFIDTYEGGSTIAEVLLTDPRALRHVRSWRQLRSLPEAVLPRLETNLFWLLKRDRVLAEFSAAPWYRRTAFDEYGDVVAHLRPEHAEQYRAAREQARAGMTASRPARWGRFEDEAKVVVGLKNLARGADQAGAKAILLFPCIPRPLFEANREALTGLESRLRGELGAMVQSSPSDCVLAPSEFFDSDYHLGPEARAANVGRLRAVLAPFRKKPPEPATKAPPGPGPRKTATPAPRYSR